MSIIHAFRTQVGWISVPDSAGFALKIPFLQLDHARKSDSVAQNPSDFFVRLSMCLELNALRSGCSEESPLGTHLDFYSKVHSYELFVGNVIIYNDRLISTHQKGVYPDDSYYWDEYFNF